MWPGSVVESRVQLACERAGRPLQVHRTKAGSVRMRQVRSEEVVTREVVVEPCPQLFDRVENLHRVWRSPITTRARSSGSLARRLLTVRVRRRCDAAYSCVVRQEDS